MSKKESVKNKIIHTSKTVGESISDKILLNLRSNFIKLFNQDDYDRWIKELIVESNHEKYTLITYSDFILNKIQNKYKVFIDKYFTDNNLSVDVIKKSKNDNEENNDDFLIKGERNNNLIPKSTLFKSNFNENFRFNTFVDGDSNRFAYHSSKRLVDCILKKKSIKNLNPLYICGPVGLGKTHLLHSIAQEILDEDKKLQVLYMPAESFMHEFIKAIRNKSISQFKEMFRNVDVLLFDDIQFLSDRTEKTLWELGQVLDLLISMNKVVVLSSDRPPKDLEIKEIRIKSRLMGGLVADIDHSDFELRLSILQSKIKYINHNIQEDELLNILNYLAENVTSSIRELEGALNKVIEYSKIASSDLNVETVKNILHHSIQNNKKISIDSIVSGIAKYFKVNKSEIVGKGRVKNVALSRQIAMYLSRTLTGESLSNIGNYFGGRAHSSVIHSIKKMMDSVKHNTQLSNHINNLKETINN